MVGCGGHFELCGAAGHFAGRFVGRFVAVGRWAGLLGVLVGRRDLASARFDLDGGAAVVEHSVFGVVAAGWCRFAGNERPFEHFVCFEFGVVFVNTY